MGIRPRAFSRLRQCFDRFLEAALHKVQLANQKPLFISFRCCLRFGFAQQTVSPATSPTLDHNCATRRRCAQAPFRIALQGEGMLLLPRRREPAPAGPEPFRKSLRRARPSQGPPPPSDKAGSASAQRSNAARACAWQKIASRSFVRLVLSRSGSASAGRPAWTSASANSCAPNLARRAAVFWASRACEPSDRHWRHPFRQGPIAPSGAGCPVRAPASLTKR